MKPFTIQPFYWAALVYGSLSLTLQAANPQVTMKTTLGNIVLELDAEKAPISTHNFLKYAESKYYDGTIFHRVIPTFMIQGGGFDEKLDKKTTAGQLRFVLPSRMGHVELVEGVPEEVVRQLV